MAKHRSTAWLAILAPLLAAAPLTACAPTATETAPTPAGPTVAMAPPAGAPAAPSAQAAGGAGGDGCVSAPMPVVAVTDFGNTTSQYGTTVTGVEEAAAARLITLLKETGCYDVVERSVLLDIIASQGLEALDPETIARAAGAGYVVTGVVTRATISSPQVALFGVRVGQTSARVEVDIRVTDIITGSVLVSFVGAGEASNPNVAFSAAYVGHVAFDDPNLGPLIATASSDAVASAVATIRGAF
jgi:curli biogenesis system outer membrane secretion channel CsgG